MRDVLMSVVKGLAGTIILTLGFGILLGLLSIGYLALSVLAAAVGVTAFLSIVAFVLVWIIISILHYQERRQYE